MFSVRHMKLLFQRERNENGVHKIDTTSVRKIKYDNRIE